MCGITGILTHKGSPQEHERFIRWSMKQMQRRGPDSEGYLALGNVAFGFRRLAIRDPHERANQPMYSEPDGCALIYNGELYNTDFLKSKLPAATKFKTSSDTEVLFHCLNLLGPGHTLPLLDGIFAFAFYDVKSGQLTLARDRCGVKPLYYGISEDNLVFCSEYSPILCHESFSDASINPEALGQYLRLGFVPDGENIFRNTFLLPHGYSLTVSQGHMPKIERFYDYSWKENQGPIQPLDTIIHESVKEQLVSDVPIGVFQSGGIDSSLVSSHAKKIDDNLESFTIGIRDSVAMDESAHAKRFSGLLDIKNNIRYISVDTLTNLLSQNSEAFSEPFADFSSLPTLLLSQFAREKITVALSGDGGDELFWGYPRNTLSAAILPALRGSLASRLLFFLKNRTGRPEKKVPFKALSFNSIIDYAFHKTFIAGAHSWAHRVFPHIPASPFFLQNLQAELEGKEQFSDVELMNLMRKVEFDFHLQRVLLKVDRASLYHSLEVRVPLLSNRMLETSLQYCYSDCIENGRGKIPLRKILEKYVGAPHSSLPKTGFTIPIDDWMNHALSDRVSERLRNIPSEFEPFFDRRGIEDLLRSRKSEKNGWLIWAMFTLFEWSDRIFRQQKMDYANYQLCQA